MRKEEKKHPGRSPKAGRSYSKPVKEKLTKHSQPPQPFFNWLSQLDNTFRQELPVDNIFEFQFDWMTIQNEYKDQ
jgi:hypothetical protein